MRYYFEGRMDAAAPYERERLIKRIGLVRLSESLPPPLVLLLLLLRRCDGSAVHCQVG